MSYFSKFPLRRYQFDQEYLSVDITKEVNSTFNFDSREFYIDYEIRDGDTPIIIANKLYDDPELAWAVLLFNKIVSVYDQWPLDYDSLVDYINDKYQDPYAIHHYKSIYSGNEVNNQHPEYDKIPVTNFEHEVAVNDEKRKIKLITSDFIGEYVKSHTNKSEQ